MKKTNIEILMEGLSKLHNENIRGHQFTAAELMGIQLHLERMQIALRTAYREEIESLCEKGE